MKTKGTCQKSQHQVRAASLKQAPSEIMDKDCACEDGKRYHRLLKLMEDAYFETDLEGELVFFTKSFCELLARPLKKLKAASLSACFSSDDTKKIADACTKVLKTKKTSPKFNCIIDTSKESSIVVEIALSLILDSTDQPAGFSGIAKDVTEKLALKTALEESEEKYQNILESAPYSISIFSASDGRYVQVSNGFCSYTGYSSEEAIGHTAKELKLHLSEKDELSVAQLLGQDHKLDSLEMAYRTKSGRVIDTLTSTRPIRFNGKACYLSIAIDITPVNEAQKAREASEARYSAIIDAALDPISLTRLSDGKYVEVNNAFYQKSGLTPDEVIGHTSSEINLYVEPANREKLIAEIKKSGRADGIEMPVHSKDGTIATELWSCRVVQFNDEPHLVVVSKDISELKKSREALKDSEESYRTVLESAPFSITLTRLSDMTYVQVNNSFCKRVGYEREEVIGRSTVELGLYADFKDRDRFLKAFRLHGRVDGMEAQFKNKDGSLIQSLLSARRVRFQGEDCLLVISADVTDLKAAQRASEERELSHRAILESAPYSIVITRTSDSQYLQVNEAFCKRTGFSREEAIGHTPQELGIFVNPDDQKQIREIFFQKGQVNGLEVKFRGKDGKILDNLYSSTPITYNGEDCVLSITVGMEELKKTQQALRESEQKYRNILANIEEGYWEVDLRGTFTFVNEAEARIHQCEPQDLIGQNNKEFTRPEKTKEIYEVFGQIYETGIPVKVFDYEIQRDDGSIADVEVSASLLKDVDGKPIGFFGISRDVTEKRSAEKELEKYRYQLEEMVSERTNALESAQAKLVKKEKLAVLGQLTATVSHELRNPLGVIRSSNFYLHRKVIQQDEKVEKHFRRIEEQVALCDTIVGDLLEYTRGRNVSVTISELNPWIEELLDQEEETGFFRIERDLSDKLPAIAHDREKMRRVLINLIDNAVLAVKDRQVALAGEQPSYYPLVRVVTRQEGKYVIIAVSDNGIGMKDETQQHAFEPLFTTRARGTGIGLANVRKIITEHNGSIVLNSVPGEGTIVTIKLPCPE